MTAAHQAGIPVGFVSWHYYGNYPFIGPDGVEPSFPSAVAPVVALDPANTMGGPLGVEMVYLEVTPATATEAHDSAPSVSAGERASAEQGGAAPQ